MSRASMWTTAGTAAELAFIRHVLELQIELTQKLNRTPSPRDIQRHLHGVLADENPPPHFEP